MRLYTWGYDDRSPGQLKDLVLQHEIALVVDVRHRPRALNPQWDAWQLRCCLGQGYVWVRELGNRPAACAGQPVRLVDEAAGLARLLGLLRRHGTVLLLCAEQRPAGCHRQHIVAVMRQRVWDLEVKHL